MLIALGLDQHVEDLALGVDGAPQINHPPIDSQVDFVKMPGSMRLSAPHPQVRRKHRSEVVHPAADCLVRDHNPALSEQILDVTKAEREPQIEPNCLMYDLRREPISGIADLPHARRLMRLRRLNKSDPGVTKPSSLFPLDGVTRFGHSIYMTRF